MQTMQKSQIAGGRCVRPSRAPMRVSALFGKKAAAAVLEREAPATKSSKAKAKAKTKAKTTTKEEPKRCDALVHRAGRAGGHGSPA